MADDDLNIDEQLPVTMDPPAPADEPAAAEPENAQPSEAQVPDVVSAYLPAMVEHWADLSAQQQNALLAGLAANLAARMDEDPEGKHPGGSAGMPAASPPSTAAATKLLADKPEDVTEDELNAAAEAIGPEAATVLRKIARQGKWAAETTLTVGQSTLHVTDATQQYLTDERNTRLLREAVVSNPLMQQADDATFAQVVTTATELLSTGSVQDHAMAVEVAVGRHYKPPKPGDSAQPRPASMVRRQVQARSLVSRPAARSGPPPAQHAVQNLDDLDAVWNEAAATQR